MGGCPGVGVRIRFSDLHRRRTVVEIESLQFNCSVNP